MTNSKMNWINLMPGIKRVLKGGNEASGGDIEEGQDTRHTFSVYPNEGTREDGDDEGDTRPSLSGEGTTGENDGLNNALDPPTRTARSGQGPTHDYIHRNGQPGNNDDERRNGESKKTKSSDHPYGQVQKAQNSGHSYTYTNGWIDRNRSNVVLAPKPYFP
jgi:hypothetical protein